MIVSSSGIPPIEQCGRSQCEIHLSDPDDFSIGWPRLQYLAEEQFSDLIDRCNKCGKMLSGLENSLGRYKKR
jgi:hypothetical protein